MEFYTNSTRFYCGIDLHADANRAAGQNHDDP
jgi:hypothetical protein